MLPQWDIRNAPTYGHFLDVSIKVFLDTLKLAGKEREIAFYLWAGLIQSGDRRRASPAWSSKVDIGSFWLYNSFCLDLARDVRSADFAAP